MITNTLKIPTCYVLYSSPERDITTISLSLEGNSVEAESQNFGPRSLVHDFLITEGFSSSLRNSVLILCLATHLFPKTCLGSIHNKVDPIFPFHTSF